MENQENSIIATLLSYAKSDDNIRAVLLEGSRAFGKVDQYSDYDIVYVTQSSEPYFDGALLPFLTDHFGEIAVMQTPDNGDPHDVYTHLIQFASGVRIDLTFNSIAFLCKTALESATVVLLDKDNRFSHIDLPGDADFWVRQPSEKEYHSHCNQFYWCAPYVAKAVARGQTIHALALLGECLRNEYAVMLSYLCGVRNAWEKVNVGKHGTNIMDFLPPDEAHYYETLMNSYIRADENEIIRTMDVLMKEYGRLAAAVAHALGYCFDFSEAERTINFIHEKYRNDKDDIKCKKP